MGLPHITIITVVYNGAPYIEQTIQSVFNQSYDKIEYIIIDGGSRDGTVDIIKRNADRITYWISEKDNGIYDAMNKGWLAARKESFILFLGAGDRLISLPDNMHEFDMNDVVYGKVLMGDRMFLSRAGYELKMTNTLHHQALLVHKSVHSAPPFDTRFKSYADFDFNQRLLKNGAHFVYSDDLTAYARPGGLSGKTVYRETLMIIKKNYGLAWCVLALVYLSIRKIYRITKNFFTLLNPDVII